MSRLVKFDLPAQRAGKIGVRPGFGQLQRLLRGCHRVGKIIRLGVRSGQCVKDERVVAAA